MRKRVLLGLILTAAIAVRATDKLQPLNVKVGLWEVTQTIKKSGQIPIPADTLSKLTPEQRARLEERMKAQPAETTRTKTYKSCITKEKLDRALAFGEDSKKCAQTILTSTGSKVTLRVECAQEGVKTNGTLEFQAISSENIKGSAHMTATGGDRTMNLNSTYTGKWIGSACGNVK